MDGVAKHRLVFFTTCHGEVLRDLLRRSPAFARHYVCDYVSNYQPAGNGYSSVPIDKMLPLLQDCRVLVYHNIYGLSYEDVLARMPQKSVTIFVPYPTTLIYWPTHSLNEPIFLIKHGNNSLIPFPCLVLNRMIEELGDKNTIIGEYVSADLSRYVDFDANFAAQIGYLERAQASTPFDIASLVKARFQKEPLFHYPNHPALPIFEYMAGQLLELLGLDASISRACDPFAKRQTPIHPSVARYYGLQWCKNDPVYFLAEDVRCTFSEYVGLYVDAYKERLLAKDCG